MSKHTKLSDIVDLPPIDPQYGAWLAGFCDGEATFSISNSTTPTFRIKLREDDVPILFEIQQVLGVGSVRHEPRKDPTEGRDQYVLSINGASCTRVVEALDNRMRAKKKRDFDLWKQAVDLCVSSDRSQSAARKKTMKDISSKIKDVRSFRQHEVK